MVSHSVIDIWAIYYKSLTRSKAILGRIPLQSLPFGVTSAEVTINCLDGMNHSITNLDSCGRIPFLNYMALRWSDLTIKYVWNILKYVEHVDTRITLRRPSHPNQHWAQQEPTLWNQPIHIIYSWLTVMTLWSCYNLSVLLHPQERKDSSALFPPSPQG